MEFIALILAVIIGFVMGWNAREAHAKAAIKQFVSNLEEKIDSEAKDSIPITIEVHKEQYYVYGRDNNEFMAQGASRKELEAALEERYPGKKFACSEEILKKIGFMS